MGIRTTGLVSNLDTESIIKDLMDAQSIKKTKVENKITKLEWKQEKWKELNTKIYALYTDTLSKMKTEGTYLAKKATSSNESKLTVTAGKDAAEGTHKVTVEKLASSQYLTGGVLPDYENSEGELTEITRTTKLSDLGFSTDGSSVIRIKMNGADQTTELSVDKYTTVADFISTCKDAGLNASFDTTYKRIFLSSGTSGVEGAFSITTGISSASEQREDVKAALGYDNLSATNRLKADQLIDDYKAAALESDAEAISDAEEALADFLYDTVTDKIKNDTETAYRAGLASPSDFDQSTLDGLIETALSDAEGTIADKAEALGTALGAFTTAVEDETFSASTDGGLENLGLADISYSVSDGGELVYDTFSAGTSGASMIAAADSEITYNGASFTGSSNSFTINGLTMTMNGLTEGDSVTVNVSKDVDTVYTTVKSFITQYNELLKEMNDLYGADAATGYDVLTDEERDAMTDEQIEKWETKIKDSLLRRDSSLGSLLSSMKTTLSSGVTVNGKSYALSSYGIVTSTYTEEGKLHLLGDSEDSYGADYSDKLKAALSSDSETVMEVLTTVTKNLYDDMTSKMKSSSLSSALTFYNDKQLDKTMTGYKSDLSTLEDRLQEIEDRYYDQFTAMETAMSKLTSQQNSLSSLLGTSTSQ